MPIELNREGVAFARELISKGRVVQPSGYYGDSHWSFDADNGNALLGPDGNDWATYGRCHLAVNTDEPENTKARWKYPYAKRDGGEIKLYVGGLHAAASRAGQNGARAVYEEAEKLAERIKDEKAVSADGVVTKGASAPVVKAPSGDRVLRFTCTTQAVDRDGDIVVAKGLRWDEYLKNPVVLLAHNFGGLPVGKCVGIGLAPDGQSVWADIEFATTKSADEVYTLCREGFLSAVSIGFRILKASAPDHQILSSYDPTKKCQRVIHEANLLEISLVSIPANPDALRKAIAEGLVISKSLQESLMPAPNPVAAAFAWIKKTLGWSDETLAKLTAAEIAPLGDLDIKSRKSEPTSDAEDDEVDPDDGDGDGKKPKEKAARGGACDECGKPMAECKCSGAEMKDAADGDAPPAAAGSEEKCGACGKTKSECVCASAGKPPVNSSRKGDDEPEGGRPFKAGGADETKAVALDAIAIRSVDEIVEGVIAAVKAQLPDVVKSLAAPVREQVEAHVARLRGAV